MAWSAKPRDGYAISSAEGTGNILEANGFMNDRGYALEAQAGLLGNVYAESQLNPWRWQADSVDLVSRYKGYGLFQFTPAYDYFNLASQNIPGYGPNASVTVVQTTARPEDGWAQFVVLDDDILGKWNSTCWVYGGYWDSVESQYGWIRDTILATYGSNNRLTLAQFKGITAGAGGYSVQQAITFATFAFVACYERPTAENIKLDIRNGYSNEIYPILSGDTPPSPPTPGIVKQHTMPFYLYFI